MCVCGGGGGYCCFFVCLFVVVFCCFLLGFFCYYFFLGGMVVGWTGVCVMAYSLRQKSLFKCIIKRILSQKIDQFNG